MQVTVTGKQIDVGDSLRNHAMAATSAIVEKYFGTGIGAHVVISRERHMIHAEISVQTRRGLSVQSNGAAEDPYVAFDGAAERLDKRLRRHKRRLRKHHSHGKDNAGDAGEQATAYVLSADEDAVAEGAAGDGEPLIIAEMRTSIPRLSVSEAVMRLDLAELPALLFRNSSNGNLNYVYRRSDGNIGWIDPDFAEPGRAAPGSAKVS